MTKDVAGQADWLCQKLSGLTLWGVGAGMSGRTNSQASSAQAAKKVRCSWRRAARSCCASPAADRGSSAGGAGRRGDCSAWNMLLGLAPSQHLQAGDGSAPT